MTDNEMRVLIAEARGFRPNHQPHGQFWIWPDNYLTCSSRPYAELDELPPLDLNAMHEAEKSLVPDKFGQYLDRLREITQSENRYEVENRFELVHATARQRAEAFLLTT